MFPAYNYLPHNNIGAGIYLHHGRGRVLPNISVITTDHSGRIPRFRCFSGSSTPNVGKLIDPRGKDITNSPSDPFIVQQGSSFEPGSLVVSSVKPLNSTDVGIYTCHIPDENGVLVDVNFGLYLSSTTSNNNSYIRGEGATLYDFSFRLLTACLSLPRWSYYK